MSRPEVGKDLRGPKYQHAEARAAQPRRVERALHDARDGLVGYFLAERRDQGVRAEAGDEEGVVVGQDGPQGAEAGRRGEHGVRLALDGGGGGAGRREAGHGYVGR